MKKYFNKLDKKFKLNDRLGLAYDDKGRDQVQLPPGFRTAGPSGQPPPQQQFAPPHQQQHQQEYAPPQQHDSLPQPTFSPPVPSPGNQQSASPHQHHSASRSSSVISPQQFYPPPPTSPESQQYFPPPPPPPPPQHPPADPQSALGMHPTRAEINRYRIQHGVNLGSIFVLERWLFPSMFLESSAGGSELSAVTASVSAFGIEATRIKWEQHWESALTTADWEFLRDTAKASSMRLPVGWFTLGPKFCEGTAFDGVKEVYTGAWDALVRFLETAAGYGIGVLLDFHALPGGVNAEEHSGTDSKAATFWENSDYQRIAISALVELAKLARSPVIGDWIIGLQVCNEAMWGSGDRGMWSWYDRVLAAIAEVDNTLPVYISDAWNSGPALDYAVGKNVTSRAAPLTSPPVIVDIHKYYCFSDIDKMRSPSDHIASIPTALADLQSYFDKEAAIVIGEYSCVLSNESWNMVSSDQRPGLVSAFGRTQVQRWEDALRGLSGGAFFWTAKMDWMDGGEWGFFEQTKAGNLPQPSVSMLSQDQLEKIKWEVNSQYDSLKTTAVREHQDYWKDVPGIEVWRFENGFEVGFRDAVTFLERGCMLGFGNLWVGKRVREHVKEHGGWGSDLRWLWEFEHGAKKGIRDVEERIRV